MAVQPKQLSYEQIDRSAEIQKWLQQFGENRTIAIEMLLRLKFISRDIYASWLKETIESIREEKTALFAVRKSPEGVQSLWDEQGRYLPGPEKSLGSEDLIKAEIANLWKRNRNAIFDHPNLETIRDEKVHQLILVEDSIGSGKRVQGFLRRLFNHKTIRSWWSYGLLEIVILALARVQESDKTILTGIPGSNHGIRKFPATGKVRLVSHIAYAKTNLSQRWGTMSPQILQFCKDENRVPRDWRMGFKKTMANIVFYHSVPNNLPGILWHQSDDWEGLFPNRSFPTWLQGTLDNHGMVDSEVHPPHAKLNEEMGMILRLAKRGIRTENNLAWHLGLDVGVVKKLVDALVTQKLLTSKNRITSAGRQYLRNATPASSFEFDYSLYIPENWCAECQSVQPPEVKREDVLLQAESGFGSPEADGEVGQTSLEETDAKTAMPSLGIMPEIPARSWDGHDAHGPSGPKES